MNKKRWEEQEIVRGKKMKERKEKKEICKRKKKVRKP